MRYKLSEDIILAGKLAPGATVTVKVLDLATDTFVSLSTSSCSESSKIAGLYLWSTSNIAIAVTGYKNCYYEMTDGINFVSGKFVYGGYIEDMDTQLTNIDTQLDGVDTRLVDTQATVGTIDSTVSVLPSASENAAELLGTVIRRLASC